MCYDYVGTLHVRRTPPCIGPLSDAMPSSLSACGHTFCSSCLNDWFNTTLAHHMQAHPHYTAEITVPAQFRARQNHPRMAEALRRYIAEQRERMPHPQYTCPTCREVVLTKPVEVYALKEMVRMVAAMLGGQSSPKKVVNRAHGGPFDGFFPNAL